MRATEALRHCWNSPVIETHCPLGNVSVISDAPFSNWLHGLMFWAFPMRLLSWKCHTNPLMVGQHWFRYWLGLVRQQAITWANVDPKRCHRMVSWNFTWCMWWAPMLTCRQRNAQKQTLGKFCLQYDDCHFRKMHLNMSSAKYQPFCWGLNVFMHWGRLTYCGLMTPYGDRDLGQHWLRQWLVAWRHQAITWTNVDFPSAMPIGIHLSTILQEILQPSIIKLSWKINFLKFHSNLPGVNESTAIADIWKSWLFCTGWATHYVLMHSFVSDSYCNGCYYKGTTHRLNSSPPIAAYMRQWTGTALIQVMAWRRAGDKPLPEPMLIYCQLDP